MPSAFQQAPGRSGDTFIDVIRIAGRESYGDVGSDTPLVVGAVSFNPDDHIKANATLALFFRVIAANGNTPLTTHAKLVNVTDSDDIATVNFVDTTDLSKQEVALTLGSGAGQIDQADKVYEVQIYVDSPVDEDDTIEIHSAEIRIVNTVL